MFGNGNNDTTNRDDHSDVDGVDHVAGADPGSGPTGGGADLASAPGGGLGGDRASDPAASVDGRRVSDLADGGGPDGEDQRGCTDEPDCLDAPHYTDESDCLNAPHYTDEPDHPDLVAALQNVPVGARVIAVERLLADLAHLSADDLENDDLLDSVRSVERLRRYADSVSCRLLAEIEKRKVTDTASGLMTATWLARHADLPAAVAKRRVRLAKKLADDLPSVSEALADGRLGLDQAGVLADAANPRIAEQIDAATDDLCASISGSTFGRWKNEVRSLADLLDQDGGHDPSNDIERNHLSLSMTGSTLVLRGELTGENALIARGALNKIADQLFARYSRDHEVTPDIEVPNRKTLMALALIEAARRALGSKVGRAPHPEATLILTPVALDDAAGFPMGGSRGSRSSGFSPANGFTFPTGLGGVNGSGGRHRPGRTGDDRVAESSSGAGGVRGSDGAGPTHPDASMTDSRYPDSDSAAACFSYGPWGSLDLTSSSDAFDDPDAIWFTGASPPTAPPPVAGSGRLGTDPVDPGSDVRSWRGFTVRDEEGVPLPRRSWEALMCDPALYPIVIDSLGVPVDMGRQVRLATQAQRRALAVRDGGCVFPGCEMPASWTEAHHETEWQYGGRTDVKDLALLCRHHHRVAHRPGWLIEVLDDGTTRWTTPMGQVFAGQQHGRTVGGPTSTEEIAGEPTGATGR